jgi:hypothetical protein
MGGKCTGAEEGGMGHSTSVSGFRVLVADDARKDV